MSLADTVNAYYMPLYSTKGAVVEYYSEIFEGVKQRQYTLRQSCGVSR
jgi:hypothetical protein